MFFYQYSFVLSESAIEGEALIMKVTLEEGKERSRFHINSNTKSIKPSMYDIHPFVHQAFALTSTPALVSFMEPCPDPLVVGADGGPSAHMGAMVSTALSITTLTLSLNTA